MRHQSYVTPLVTEGMLGWLMHAAQREKSPTQLTTRQREVLPVARGGEVDEEVASFLQRGASDRRLHTYA